MSMELTTITRYWISWYQPTEDYRPITDPPTKNVLAWWNSGERDSDGAATLCAIIAASSADEAERTIQKSWPEAAEFRFNEKKSKDWLPGDSFSYRSEMAKAEAWFMNELETITRVLQVPASQNIGCTTCSDQAVQVTICEGEFGCEIVSAECKRHREVE
jgi:hypothetical protein